MSSLVDVGVVPILCEELFKGIDQKKKDGDKTEYEASITCRRKTNLQLAPNLRYSLCGNLKPRLARLYVSRTPENNRLETIFLVVMVIILQLYSIDSVKKRKKKTYVLFDQYFKQCIHYFHVK